jgi:hypothetical protein
MLKNKLKTFNRLIETEDIILWIYDFNGKKRTIIKTFIRKPKNNGNNASKK